MPRTPSDRTVQTLDFTAGVYRTLHGRIVSIDEVEEDGPGKLYRGHLLQPGNPDTGTTDEWVPGLTWDEYGNSYNEIGLSLKERLRTVKAEAQ